MDTERKWEKVPDEQLSLINSALIAYGAQTPWATYLACSEIHREIIQEFAERAEAAQESQSDGTVHA